MSSLGTTIRRFTLGAGLGLIILGIGNIIYGEHKTAEYLQVLADSSSNLPQTPDVSPLPSLSRYISTDTYRTQIARVRSRVDFYEVVIVGGQYLTGTGGFLLLLWLVISSRGWRGVG